MKKEKIEEKLDEILKVVQGNCKHKWTTELIEPQELNPGGVVATCSVCGKTKYWYPNWDGSI